MDHLPPPVRAAEDRSGEFRSLAPAVHRGSTVVFDSMAEYGGRRDRFYDGYSYGLYGTPTSRELERRIAALEGAARSFVVPSGMAAITLVTLACAGGGGGRVLFPDSAYDPVRTLAATLLVPYGVEAVFYDPLVGRAIAGLLTPSTRLVWVESPGSVTMEVQDVPAIAEAARLVGARVAADSTWATPLRCRALELGADFAANAVSKYLNGHSDVLMGAVSVRDEALYRRLRDVARALGHGVSPEDCALVMRGLETLELRLDRAETTGLRLARWLAARPEVETVLHPALPSCPGHDAWRRDFRGASGVFSVVLRPWTRPRLPAVVEALRHFTIGASWGATRSIVAPMDPAPPRTAVPWSAPGPILRVSAGLEDPAALEADLAQAFALFGPAPDAAGHPIPAARGESSR